MPIRGERPRTVPRPRAVSTLFVLVAVLLADPSAVGGVEPTLAGGSVEAPRRLLDVPLLEVEPDPRVDGRLYAVTAGHELLRSTDGGATWVEIGAGPFVGFQPGVADVELDPHDPDVLYAKGTAPGTPVLRSTDAGESFDFVGSDPPDLERFAVVEGSAGEVLLVGVRGPRLFRSVDRGESWIEVGEIGGFGGVFGFAPRKPTVVEGHPETLYLTGRYSLPGFCGSACIQERLYRSLDAGATWVALELPFVEGPGHLRIDPRDPDTLYAAAEGTFFRSADRGETWEVVSGPPTSGAMDVVLDPRRPAALYRVTFQDGVFHTSDGGESWRRVAPGFAPVGLRDLAFLDSATGADTLYPAGQGGLWAVEVAPPVPPGPSFLDPDFAGFRTWVRISAPDGAAQPVRAEPVCLPETLCVSGALPGRSELFVRIVGPKPNGRLWPTLVRFTTSRVEVWLEQTATGEVEYYELPGTAPGRDELDGLFDREGFEP